MKALRFKKQHLWKGLNDSLKTFGCELASSLLAAPSVTGYYFQVALASLKSPKQILVRVEQAVRAILALIKALVSSATINNRFYLGLVLVSIVAPLSACIHMIPGMKQMATGEEFYKNSYDLFLVLGPYFFSLFIVITAFLWIPPKTNTVKFSRKNIKFQLTRLLSLPFGYCVGKIIWLCRCASNEDFERFPSALCLAVGVIVGYVVMRILDYLVWRQEHAMNALIDTLEGLYHAPNIDLEVRNQHASAYWKELREFHSKY